MLLNRFPCRVGTPIQQWCDTKEEALTRINAHNGATNVYVSIYNNDIIDKVAWDFDIDPEKDDAYDDWEDMLADFRKLTEQIDEDGYQQMSVLSGGGMHKYMKTVPENLEHPKAAIAEVQKQYQNDLDLMTDTTLFGDTKQIMRVPNTYHPGAGRYCIPLKPEEVYYEPEELFGLAEEQRTGINPLTKGEAYPIRQHDKMGSGYTSFGTDGEQISGNFNPAEVEPEGTVFPIYPCIANLLQNWEQMDQKGHGLGFRRRFLIILHLKETGHSYEETVSILKKYMSEKEFYHAVYDEKQVRQIWKRDDMLFPRCDSLMEEIPCIHDPEENDECEDKDTLYV